jgi:hypothetical protein
MTLIIHLRPDLCLSVFADKSLLMRRWIDWTYRSAFQASINRGQFWLCYLNALIDCGRGYNAKSVLNQAAELGVKSHSYDQLYVRMKRSR